MLAFSLNSSLWKCHQFPYCNVIVSVHVERVLFKQVLLLLYNHFQHSVLNRLDT